MLRRSSILPFVGLAVATLAAGCGAQGGALAPSDAASVLHLDDLLDGATIDVPTGIAARGERSWDFAEARPEWRTISGAEEPRLAAVRLEQLPDGVRLTLDRPPRQQGPAYVGGLAVELEPTPFDDWEAVQVRARSSTRLGGITVGYNLDEPGATPGDMAFFLSTDEAPPVFSDGSVQTYAIPLRPRAGDRPEALRSLGVFAGAPGAASLDILAVTLVPRGSSFAAGHGIRAVTRQGETRRTLYAHTPAAISWPLALPAGARLDLGLTALAGEAVTYRITARRGEETTTLGERSIEGDGSWEQLSVDLGRWSGRDVDLELAALSERPGAVALWGAPVVSGAVGEEGSTSSASAAENRPTGRPNVIFYVIDGGGADLMSVYGYNRRTTPFLERLAAEGAVFEHAYSNATWTQPSTASFMTSLQHSVLGGLRRGVHSTPVPAAAVTMAEHMRRGGYQTASFTSNPNSGRIIGLERGVDVMRDGEAGHHSTSSQALHESFWRWREVYPGEPYWVHFQTTDVHEPNQPEAPFAGLFVSSAEVQQLEEWDARVWQEAAPLFGTTSISALYDAALQRSGVDRQGYFSLRRALYDETMAHQDHQLGRLVERLKERGEWERTLLVVASDHGHPAGTFARFGRGQFVPQPEPWQGALFDSYSTRVPLIVVWPGRVAGGQRLDEPVSMIDVLPTILDLVGLPKPEVVQGHSLAPPLLGHPYEARPVILDEFRVDERTGEMIGNLEIIDGRWGASLEIGPPSAGEAGDEQTGRHAVPAGGRWGAVHPHYPQAPRLLLYDLWNDPFALSAVNDQHPELVAHYRKALLEHWEANQTLAQRFSEAGEVALTPDQLQQLRSLGYIQ